jgi:RecA/RadA recombinase
MAEIPDDLSGLVASITEDLGGAARISSITEAPNPYTIRRPTSVLSLDYRMLGGWPAGTICQIFGPDGIGKDYLVNLTFAENQRIHKEKSNIFCMSFGYKPDLPFMRMAGMQLAYTDDELMDLGLDPETVTPEQRGHTTGNVLFIDLEKAAKEKPAEVLMSATLKLIESNRFQIGVINELGSGETKDNVKKTLAEDAKLATFASLMSDFCRKWYTAMRIPGDDGGVNLTTLLMVNPVRANLDTNTSKYRPYVQGSGHALKHAKVIDLHLDHGKFIYQSRVKVGKQVKWKIGKGKHGISEGAEGLYDFYYETGVDLVTETANAAKAVGTIKRRGPYYYILDSEESIKGGIAAVITMLREDRKLYDKVVEATVKKIHV